MHDSQQQCPIFCIGITHALLERASPCECLCSGVLLDSFPWRPPFAASAYGRNLGKETSCPSTLYDANGTSRADFLTHKGPFAPSSVCERRCCSQAQQQSVRCLNCDRISQRNMFTQETCLLHKTPAPSFSGMACHIGMSIQLAFSRLQQHPLVEMLHQLILQNLQHLLAASRHGLLRYWGRIERLADMTVLCNSSDISIICFAAMIRSR